MGIVICLWLINWSDEIYIAQDTIEMSYPIAMSYKSDSILCIWRESPDDNTFQIKGSFFDSTSWSAPEQLSPDTLGNAWWYGRPSITVDSSNNIWISWWCGPTPTKKEVYQDCNGIYTRTYDGTQWEIPILVERALAFDLNMCTAKNGKVFIGWDELTLNTGFGWAYSIFIGWHEGSGWSAPLEIAKAHNSGYDTVWSYWNPCLAGDISNSVFIAYYEHCHSPYGYSAKTTIIDQFNGDSVVNIGYKEEGNNWNPVIDVDSYNKLWLAWVSDRDGDKNVYSSYYQDGVWSEDMQVTTDSFADLEPAIVCHKNGVPWITWTSRKDSSIWTAYYVGGDWHLERVSKEDSSRNSNPCIIEGPQGKLWVFWQKLKGDTNSICCSWRELVGAEELTPYTLTPKPQLRAYPNPFTSKTVIRYSLPVDYTIHDSRLTIHDISGRLIQTFHLTNDQSQVVWDTKELPGGVYFLHLNMGNIKEVKKLTLLR